MKNLKKGLLALALVAGISGALVTNSANAAKRFDQMYDWTHYDTDGSTIIGTDLQKSVAQEQASTNCNSNLTRCAVGTAPGKPSVTLKYAF